MSGSIKSVVGFLGWCSAILGCAHFRPPTESGIIDQGSVGRFAKIEDAEDGDDQILRIGGRNGYIYTYTDERGTTIEPGSNRFRATAGGAAGSAFALRITGTTANSGAVFAGVGLSFREPVGPYNASRCRGIAFIAKKEQGSVASLRVKVPDVNTAPEGGICRECYNDFGITLQLTDRWTRYLVSFSDLKQEQGWGDPSPLTIDSTKLFGLQWQTAVPGVAFDIWIDDVEFVDCDN